MGRKNSITASKETGNPIQRCKWIVFFLNFVFAEGFETKLPTVIAFAMWNGI
jgi:hypothetical protein